MPKYSVLYKNSRFLERLESALTEKQGLSALQVLVEKLAATFPASVVRLGSFDAQTRIQAVFWLQNGRPVTGQHFWEMFPGQKEALLSDAGVWQGVGEQAGWIAVRLGEGTWWGLLEVLFAEASEEEISALAGLLKQIARLLTPDFMRWRLQTVLQKEIANQELLANSIPVWTFWLRPDGRFQVFSAASEQYTGRPAAYFADRPAWLLRLVHPEDRKKFHQHREDLLFERDAVFDFRLIHPEDGSVYHLRHVCRPAYGPDGQYLGRIGVNEDITAFRRREEQLQAHLRRFKVIYELAQDFSSGLTSEQYARSVLQILQRHLHWKFAAIWQYDADQDRFRVLAAMEDGALGDASLHQRINRRVRTSQHGLVGAAVRERRAIRVGDVRKDPRYIEGGIQARSGIYVPMMSHDVPVGVLVVESQQVYAFSAEDLELLEMIAGYAASVLENIRLIESINQQVLELAALYEATRQLSLRRLDAEAVYEIIHRAVARLMPFDAFTIVFYDEEKQQSQAVYLYEDGERYPPVVLPLEEGLSGRVWRAKRPLVFRDYSRSNQMRAKRYIFGPEDRVVRSVLAVPLKIGGQLLGMMAVQSYQRGLYGKRERSLLQNLSTQAAVALENARLFVARQRSMRQLEAIVDVLRLLVAPPRNRREILERILERALSVIPNAEKGTLILRQPDGTYRVQVAQGYQDTIFFGLDFYLSQGYAGYALREKQPVLAQDAPRHYPLPFDGRLDEPNQVLCGMAVPLLDGSQVLGAICIDNCTDPVAFHDEDLVLLESFAHTASAVLLRLQSLDELQQQLEQVEQLARLGTLLRASDRPDDILQMVCKTLKDALHLRLSVVFVRRKDGGFSARFVAGTDAAVKTEFHLPADDALLLQVWESGQPVIVSNVASDMAAPAHDSQWLQKDDALAIWPLFDEEKLVGALGLVRKQPFSEADQAKIAMIAQMTGNAVARSRLLTEISGYASRLTEVNLLWQSLAEAPDLPALYKHLLQRFQDLFPQAHSLRLLRADTNFHSTHVVAYLESPAAPVQFPIEPQLCPFRDGCRQCLTDVKIPVEVHLASDTSVRFWCLPFTLPGQTYGRGALQFALPADLAISPQDQKLLQMIGRLMAAEIARQEYQQDIQRDAARWELLVLHARDMAAAFSRENLYLSVYRTAQEMLGCQRMQLFLLDKRQEYLRLVFSMPADSAWAPAEILLSGDAKGEPFLSVLRRRQPELAFEDGRSLLYIPILHGASAYGVMVLGWDNKHHPAMSERQMIEALASQLAVLLRNFDLRENLESRLRYLESLRTIDTAITSSTDPKVVLDLIVREIMRLAGADIVSVLYFDDEVRRFHYSQGRGYSSAAFTDLSGFTVQSPAFQALISVQPVYVTRPEDWQQFGGMDLRLLSENVQSVVYYPLVAKQSLHGVLEVCFRSEQTLDDGRKQFIETLAGQAAIAIDNFHLFDALERSNRELQMAYDETIEGWALALEMRDRETEGHTRRVTDLTVRLARRLGIPEDEIVHIRRGALLHDIGKMGIPDSILHKPGKLTDEEWQIMRKHPEMALSFLSHIAYLRPALDIPYSHHEKWDGSGYPLGLKGEQIPLAARIFAIADVYDALVTDRPYRKAWPKEKVLQYIAEQAGKHFDPHVVQEFMNMLQDEE